MPTKKLDKMIEQAYYRLAAGKQISIMDIPKVYRDCRSAIAGGTSVDAAVTDAVARYCLAQ